MSDTTAHEEPELIQLLTPEGEPTGHPDYPLDISAEEVRALYIHQVFFCYLAYEKQLWITHLLQ